MLHDVSHRTTLTLDDDVAARLEREVHRTGRAYRSVVNDALRRGLDATPDDLPAFRVDARPMGLRSGMSVDDIAGLLDRLDGAAGR